MSDENKEKEETFRLTPKGALVSKGWHPDEAARIMEALELTARRGQTDGKIPAIVFDEEAPNGSFAYLEKVKE